MSEMQAAPYANRTDLNAGAAGSPPAQPVQAPSGQPYGARGQQEAAQRSIPLPDFAAQTARPNEPVTQGMDSGPGLSAAAAGMPVAPRDDTDAVAMQLRAIYAVYPTS